VTAAQEKEVNSIEAAQKRARSFFESMSLPDPSEESWRKIDLGGFEFSAYLERSVSSLQVGSVSGNAVCANFLSNEKSTEAEKSAGVASLLSERLDFDKNIFVCHNIASLTHGVYITLSPAANEKSEDAKALNGYVEISHSLQSGRSLIHRTVIDVPKNGHLRVLERFQGRPSQETSYWNVGVDVRLGAGARLDYIVLSDLNGDEYFFRDFLSRQSADSRLFVGHAMAGGMKGKSLFTAKILESGAEFRGSGVFAGSGSDFHDLEMKAEHLADHSQSSLLYKTVLKDRSHSVFNGNLSILPGLKHVSSHQVNNNVLLGRKARAESMPRLVIKADDVRAEHGATVGELDRDSLFFLMSRGIPESEARDLLIQGFLTQVIDELPIEEIRGEVLEMLNRRISRGD